MSVTIKYKGNTIASANTDTTKTLKTSGKYCEGDILVENVQDGGITPTGNINITDTNVTDVTNYATAQVVSENLKPENIKKNIDILGVLGSFEGGGGGSLPSVISKLDGGSFTVSSDTLSGSYSISHNLGETPKGFLIWSEDIQYEAYAVRTAVKIAYNEGENPEYLYWQINTNSTGRYGAQAWSADDLTSTTFKASISANYYKVNATYKWLAWA